MVMYFPRYLIASATTTCFAEVIKFLGKYMSMYRVCVCVCVFGFNVAFNNFSVISRGCLVATGSPMLTFIVLPH